MGRRSVKQSISKYGLAGMVRHSRAEHIRVKRSIAGEVRHGEAEHSKVEYCVAGREKFYKEWKSYEKEGRKCIN